MVPLGGQCSCVLWNSASYTRYYRLQLGYSYSVQHEEYFNNLVDEDENRTYMVIVITTFAEIPGLILVALLMNRVGRKKSQAIAFFGSGIFVALLILDASIVLSTMFAFGARALIYGSFAATFAYTPEVRYLPFAMRMLICYRCILHRYEELVLEQPIRLPGLPVCSLHILLEYCPP
jgi:MFS family permease